MNWTYFQRLPEIVAMLSSAEHYVTARLAKYHINNRRDSLQDQLMLYDYLNKNYFIISCNRTNLFEYAISWCFYAYTKKLNAFSAQEKKEIYSKLTADSIYIDPKVMTNHLNNYLEYEDWVQAHFQVNATYNYEIDSQNLEHYCRKLNLVKRSWQDNYGIDWNDFNRCHYIQSDTSDIALQLTNTGKSDIKLLTSAMLDEHLPSVSKVDYAMVQQDFLQRHIDKYRNISADIVSLVDQKILPNGIPIKLQTLAEKYKLVQNIDECLETYNRWAVKNGAVTYTNLDLANQAVSEIKYWYDIT